MSQSNAPSERTRVRRLPERAAYDRAVTDPSLDEALICHVGFEAQGQPFVIPTIHVRIGGELYLHGSAASRMLERGGGGARLCVTVTLVDGIVLARSAFHHSMNYRSVVVLGQARAVSERAEKLEVLAALVNRFVAGRSEQARAPSDLELKATLVLALPLTEASAKLRTGGPKDDDSDLSLPVWAGVIPVRLRTEPAQAAEPRAPGLEVPELGLGLPRR
jgi:uncharacterized protein